MLLWFSQQNFPVSTGDFLGIIFCYSFLATKLVSKEQTQNDFGTLKYVEMCLISWPYFSTCFLCSWQWCIFFSYRYSVYVCLFGQLCYLISSWFAIPYPHGFMSSLVFWGRCIKVSYCDCGLVFLSIMKWLSIYLVRLFALMSVSSDTNKTTSGFYGWNLSGTCVCL